MEFHLLHHRLRPMSFWQLTGAKWKDLKRLARWLNRSTQAPITGVGSLLKEDLAAEIWLKIN